MQAGKYEQSGWKLRKDLHWMNAYTSGVLQSPPKNKKSSNCILPNAAIGWKQPNGFYYPPAVLIPEISLSPMWTFGIS